MPTIGAHVCNWTILLLLCSIPTFAQATDETTRSETDSATSIPSSNTPTKTPSSIVTPSPSSKPSTASYSPDTTCPFRTINYITHTLPQQCLKTSWSAPTQAASSRGSDSEGEASPSPWVTIPWTEEGSQNDRIETKQQIAASSAGSPSSSWGADAPAGETASSTTTIEPGAEAETDSPLDNANFLSFEDWKKKNLARAGQSPENVGQGRAASSENRNRRRPVNINALDALGEDSEIEIDFGGFGNTGKGDEVDSGSPSGTQDANDRSSTEEGEDKAAPSSWALSKDAGKTCKERFNYASFDCAATVLKTNPQAKSSSTVLVENKDSYMLNECSAQNKFIIVELCDDILVDTVVLANFEFFSSMFRHFRVSVSDRYPVKMDRWRMLDTFEARNSRDIQPFLVTAPQIWARYLRIEFLTHYGNEFYCPISLLRVHGTTMMEQFRREEEEARGDDDFAEPIEAAEGEPVMTAAAVTNDSESNPTEEVPNKPTKDVESVPEEPKNAENTTQPSESVETASQPVKPEPHRESSGNGHTESAQSGHSTAASKDAEAASGGSITPLSPPPDSSASDVVNAETAQPQNNTSTESPTPANSTEAVSSSQSSPSEEKTATATPISSQNGKSISKAPANETSNIAPSTATVRSAFNSTANSTQPHTRSSQTQPNSASPTTQESFFKSIHKRLQQLEANSTLSLQYIEEQSRILRDAFIKVEKRQLSKTENFLDHLNSTVMQELKSYRGMYDQLWQSTILELEGMKERQKAEIGEIGARLSLVADELVWQKRMAVVQSTLLLLCLGLVLFVRSGTLGAQLDVPIVQQLGNKYSRFFDTPPESPEAPGSVRRRRGFRSMWRSDTSGLRERSGHLSDGVNLTSDAETEGRRSPVQIEFSPPTPVTPSGGSDLGHETGDSPPSQNNSTRVESGEEDERIATPTVEADTEPDEQAKRIQVLATQSGPATPRGSRDSRPSWEEVDRAVDMLRAEEQGKEKEREQELGRQRRNKRSPLRRAETYDDAADDSLDDDDGGELFVAG
ncbi:hypothetical protein K469DRAFT_713433 [Zopfia rhizophila CBS 207.26]|uniref:SUN domain-containing protein n=1 Tax=Zopfia rhizophila CBS 207.26 TaxID=1314779 RepID=A0A6A6DTX4_9PEZI|nr:hypothetical protein K469DRAFT_713433 [Zopfia rhizophila CBS 207.26]